MGGAGDLLPCQAPELRDTLYTLYTDGAFTYLAVMTQLTCLNLSLKSEYVQVHTFDEQLTALSTLTSLNTLRCLFLCHPCQVIWSPQVQKYVAGPMPNIGVALKVALPQAAVMSVFAIEPRTLKGFRFDYRPHGCNTSMWRYV